MNVGDKIIFCGKEYVAKSKGEGVDFCGNTDIEVELEAADGDKRWFPEWLCDEQADKKSPFRFKKEGK